MRAAEVLTLALGSEDPAEGFMFRLATETNDAGAVHRRGCFRPLRGEEGQVECFWPVPLEIEAATRTQGQFATARKTARRG